MAQEECCQDDPFIIRIFMIKQLTSRKESLKKCEGEYHCKKKTYMPQALPKYRSCERGFKVGLHAKRNGRIPLGIRKWIWTMIVSAAT